MSFPQGVRPFLLERTGKTRLALRCFASGVCPKMPGEYGYHNAQAPLFDVAEHKVMSAEDPHDRVYRHDGPQTPEDVFFMYRWPERCACGFVFQPSHRQVFPDRLYRRVDTGEVRTIREWDHVPGAMWDAEWLARVKGFGGPDGRVLHVVLPNGRQWCIDGRASNCTKPDDYEHRCWVRHGEAPNLTVGKDGNTCAAGAGSILADDYHGFLRNGVFEP